MLNIKRQTKKPVMVIRPASSLELANYEKHKIIRTNTTLNIKKLEANCTCEKILSAGKEELLNNKNKKGGNIYGKL